MFDILEDFLKGLMALGFIVGAGTCLAFAACLLLALLVSPWTLFASVPMVLAIGGYIIYRIFRVEY